MKVLFFGTPQISVEYLKQLHKAEKVVGIITRPDRQKGRGYNLSEPPVKQYGRENNIPVFQPDRFTPEIIEDLKALNADVGVIIAYGRLIPENIFTIPSLRSFNIHFSLLPKYRGAGPVQWALINGEKETGVTTFWIEKTLDSGPVLVQKPLAVDDKDDYVSLLDKLMPLGILAMNETLSKLKQGPLSGVPQAGKITYAPVLKKEDGKIDWSKPAGVIYNLIRGTRPWPGAYSVISEGKLKGKNIKILNAEIINDNKNCSGKIVGVVKDKGFAVGCGNGSLLIKQVHPEGKKEMPAWDFLHGGHFKEGDKIF